VGGVGGALRARPRRAPGGAIAADPDA